MIHNELYYRGNGGVLLEPCPSQRRENSYIESISFHVKRMMPTYKSECRDRNLTGMKWSMMFPKFSRLIRNVSNLSMQMNHQFLQEAGESRKPKLNILLHRLLLSNLSAIIKIKIKVQRFFVKESSLFQRGYDQAPLRCLVGDEVTQSLKKFSRSVYRALKALQTDQKTD